MPHVCQRCPAHSLWPQALSIIIAGWAVQLYSGPSQVLFWGEQAWEKRRRLAHRFAGTEKERCELDGFWIPWISRAWWFHVTDTTLISSLCTFLQECAPTEHIKPLTQLRGVTCLFFWLIGRRLWEPDIPNSISSVKMLFLPSLTVRSLCFSYLQTLKEAARTWARMSSST